MTEASRVVPALLALLLGASLLAAPARATHVVVACHAAEVPDDSDARVDTGEPCLDWGRVPRADAQAFCVHASEGDGRADVAMPDGCLGLPPIPDANDATDARCIEIAEPPVHGAAVMSCICQDDAVCQAAHDVLVAVEERVGQSLGGAGVCVTAGQAGDGLPYARVDAAHACTDPEPRQAGSTSAP